MKPIKWRMEWADRGMVQYLHAVADTTHNTLLAKVYYQAGDIHISIKNLVYFDYTEVTDECRKRVAFLESEIARRVSERIEKSNSSNN